LIHHRLLDGPRHLAALDREPERFAGFTKYRWDEPSMNAYLADRAAARHELVMVFEHLPHAAVDWIAGRPDDVGWIVDDIRRVIAFLRAHEVVHFDSDLCNVRTDGQQAYLTDFGLVLDRQFELSDDEHRFLDRHRHFDDGNLLLSAAHQLYWTYRAEPPDRRAALAAAVRIDEATAFDDAVTSLLAAFDRLDERGLFPIGRELHTLLSSHSDAVRYMHSFVAAARRNWTARVTFDDARLERLLRGSGYLAG
jgi:hypothetical protein